MKTDREIIGMLMDILQEICTCPEIEFTEELDPATLSAINNADNALLIAAEYLENASV